MQRQNFCGDSRAREESTMSQSQHIANRLPFSLIESRQGNVPNAVSSPNSVGIRAVRALSSSVRVCRFVKRPISVGIGPVRLLLRNDKCATFRYKGLAMTKLNESTISQFIRKKTRTY